MVEFFYRVTVLGIVVFRGCGVCSNDGSDVSFYIGVY